MLVEGFKLTTSLQFFNLLPNHQINLIISDIAALYYAFPDNVLVNMYKEWLRICGLQIMTGVIVC